MILMVINSDRALLTQHSALSHQQTSCSVTVDLACSLVGSCLGTIHYNGGMLILEQVMTLHLFAVHLLAR